MNPLEPMDPTTSLTPLIESPINDTTAAPTNPSDDSPGTVDPDKAAAALEKLAAIGGAAFDKTQMALLKAKLAKMGKSDEKTPSGSEAPADLPPDQPAPRLLEGKDVDWSEYNLDFNVAHLYPRAVYRPTPQGPKWVAMVVDFVSTTRDFCQFGQRRNAPGSKDKAVTEPANLGEYLSDMCNGREGWLISAVMPAMGGQCGILLERKVPIILPDPQPLKKTEEVEVPTDQALKSVEDAALSFMAEQKDVDNGAEESEDVSDATPVEVASLQEAADRGLLNLRPIEKGTSDHEAALAQLDENGALPERRQTLVSKALEVAAPMTSKAPTAGVVQPDAVVNPIINDVVPAAGYSAAQELLRALSDPNFRKSLPTEE